VLRAFEKLRVWLWMLLHPRRAADRLSTELEFHLDQQIAENVAAGMSREEARHTAMRTFGNPTVLREQITEEWSWTWVENFLQDTRYALRQLRQSPGVLLLSLLTLTLGIGANTAIFTLMNSLWLQGLPVVDPDRLLIIGVSRDGSPATAQDEPLNFSIIESFEHHLHSFSGIFGWCEYGADLKEGNSRHTYPGAIVSGNTFDVLGVRPAVGRLLNAADDQPGGGSDGWAVVISHQFWVEHYHADPAVIGTHVTLSDYRVTIVGVTPASFEGIIVTAQPDFYMPLNYEPVMRQRQMDSMLRNPFIFDLTTMARLKPGVTRAQASAELATLTPRIVDETFPAAIRNQQRMRQIRFIALPGRSGWSFLRIRYHQPLLLMQALVVTVLLICCANIAGLRLARTASRLHEFSLRIALGAPRIRLMRQVLIENLLLTIPGALLGLGFAWFGCRILLRLLSAGLRFPVALSTRPDITVLSLTAACAVFSALLSGAAPAWLLSRTAPEHTLRHSGNFIIRTQNRWLGQAFVCTQVALSLTLVVIAGLLSTTLVKLRLGDTGFRTKNIAAVMIDLRLRPERGVALTHLYWKMAEDLHKMPGVMDASLVAVPPLFGIAAAQFSALDEKASSESAKQVLQFNEIGSNFFSTLGISMFVGRDFVNRDADAGTCILSQAAARKLFPHSPALGSVVREYLFSLDAGKVMPQDCHVIGIVGDVKLQDLRIESQPTVYRPIAVDMPNPGLMNLVIYAPSFDDAKNAYLQTLREIAAGSPEADITPISRQLDDSTSLERLLASLSGFFAGLALLLSGIGIYGLFARSVTQRTVEFCVRMALGATRSRIMLLVLYQVIRLILIGILLGAVTAFTSARLIRSVLFGVAPGSAAVFAAAGFLLCLIALVAAFLPLRRAVNLDPTKALRTE
jgi:predicted permease